MGSRALLSRLLRQAALAGATLGPPLACASGPEIEEIQQMLAAAGAIDPPEFDHRGPGVAIAPTGPARYASTLFAAFKTDRAMETVRFADRFFRAPANPGFDAVLDRIHAELAEAGFGRDPRLTLEVLEREADAPAWTPKSARLVLLSGRKETVLHAFDAGDDRDRTMLPVHAPSAKVEGAVATSLAELDPGEILVTDAGARQVLERARSQGALAVISSSLFPFNVDPSGKERHRRAIQYREVPPGTEMPVCQISPEAYDAILAAAKDGGDARLSLEAVAELETRPLRTVVATIRGARRPGEAVAISSHVQEPGACDNASGLAGLLEGVRSLSVLLQGEALPWPDRSIVFLWGDEYRQTEMWLESTDLTAVAGLSSDMTGQSKDTGAIALLERCPDPGAVTTLPPDEHTSWGAFEVEDEWVRPNGLAVVARCALADSAVAAGGWTTGEHPWEGGSDHDVFIKMGVPAVLFWHFPDFTYHTSLDRLEFVDPQEIRRTSTALLATALALADPRPEDLDRYLKSLQREEQVRVDAADAVDNPETGEAWRRWCYGARMWLRALCLGPDAEEPPKPADGPRRDGEK